MNRCPYRLIPGAACVAESTPCPDDIEKARRRAEIIASCNADQYRLAPCGKCGEKTLLKLNPQTGRIICFGCYDTMEIVGGREAVVDQLVANAAVGLWGRRPVDPIRRRAKPSVAR